ncbi:hypothetical protein IV203_020577 [Nitzschia inconspicua]|uniref:Uncharacterized protein n=1 Tax=Nitzschia inconspicua TaxID=303405 RepID=A0A9K3KGN1_9STRA|nr:hypothetical protein IV203_020577 [Nitzschia inconspicua]
MTQTPLESFIEGLLATAPRSSGCDGDENEDDHSLSSYGSISSDEVSLDVKIVADNAKKPSQSLSDSFSLSASLGSCTDSLFDWEQQFMENKGLPSRRSISQCSPTFDAGGDMGKISSQRFQTFSEPFVDIRSPPTKQRDTLQLPLTAADRKWEEFRGSDSPDFLLRRPQRKGNNIPQLSVPIPGNLPEAPDLKQTQRKRSNLATQTTEKDLEILSHLERAASISNSPFVDGERRRRTQPQGHSTNLHYDADWNLNLSLHNKFPSRNRERPLRAAKSMPSLSWLPPRLVTPVLQDSRPHSV